MKAYVFDDAKGIVFNGRLVEAVTKSYEDWIPRESDEEFLFHQAMLQLTSSWFQWLLCVIGFEQVDHPLYSPDFVSSGYYMFSKMEKQRLTVNYYGSDDTVISSVDELFDQQHESVFNMIQALQHRWKMYVDCKEDFAEK